MAAYRYQALSRQGNKKKGVLQADSARAARSLLREQELFPVKVELVEEGDLKGGKKRFKFSLGKKRLSLRELSLVTRQLATMLHAGIPIDEALAGVGEQAEKSVVKGVLAGVRSKMLEGESLAKGMGYFKSSFPNVYRTTIAAGENSGRLDTVLLHLATYIENQRRMRSKIIQALVYPALMMVVSFLVVIFLLVKVVPQIISVVQQSHQALPTPTIILLDITHFVTGYGWYALIASVLIIMGIRGLFKNKKIRFIWDVFLLRLPLVGNTIKQINAARFARTFGILITASVPVLDAMRSATALILNMPIHKAVVEATEAVTEGVSLKRSLGASGYFPPMFLHLVGTGEQSGRLDVLLEQAALELEQDVGDILQALLTLFEPLMILFMGGIVLYIVLAVMLPIFNLDQFSG